MSINDVTWKYEEDILMSNIYFTVTGLHHYYGDSFLAIDG